MLKTWRETMKGAISEVLETMFFTPVEFIGELQQQPLCGCRSVIVLKNEKIYQAAFYFVDAHARMITANFLGKMEDEVSSDEVMDTLKEVANMIGGSFIYHGEMEDYKLGIPAFAWLDDQAQPNLQDGLPFFLDGDLFGLAVLTQG